MKNSIYLTTGKVILKVLLLLISLKISIELLNQQNTFSFLLGWIIIIYSSIWGIKQLIKLYKYLEKL